MSPRDFLYEKEGNINAEISYSRVLSLLEEYLKELELPSDEQIQKAAEMFSTSHGNTPRSSFIKGAKAMKEYFQGVEKPWF